MEPEILLARWAHERHRVAYWASRFAAGTAVSQGLLLLRVRVSSERHHISIWVCLVIYGAARED